MLAAYDALLAARRANDFDDLVVGAADRLASEPQLRMRWQARFTHVCVDEFQDVDAAQLRLVRLLAEPERNLFVVGPDGRITYKVINFNVLSQDAYTDLGKAVAQTLGTSPPGDH